MGQQLRLTRLPLGLPIVVLAWFAMELLGLTHPLFFPDLTRVLSALAGQLLDARFWYDIGATTFRAALGLLVSLVVGLPIGLLLGRNFALYRHVSLPLDFVRSIPAATLFPLFILIFGISDLSKVAVVCYGCTFIILVSATYGARAVTATDARVAMLRSLRARPWIVYRLVVIPIAIASILSGLRIATSIAFVLVIITEMFMGANDGLGKRIYDDYLAYRIPQMYANLIVLGSIGYVANLSVEKLEHAYRHHIGEPVR